MRISTALLILLTGFCLNFIGGCDGKEENTVIENPPMSAEENREEALEWVRRVSTRTDVRAI